MNEKVKLVDTSRTSVEIWEGDDSKGANFLQDTVKLDEDSRKYVHINVKNVVVTYDGNDRKE